MSEAPKGNRGFLDDMLAMEMLAREDVLKQLVGRWDDSKPSKIGEALRGMGVLVAFSSTTLCAISALLQGGLYQLAALGLAGTAFYAICWWSDTCSDSRDAYKQLEANWQRYQIDETLGIAEGILQLRQEALDAWWEMHREALEEIYWATDQRARRALLDQLQAQIAARGK